MILLQSIFIVSAELAHDVAGADITNPLDFIWITAVVAHEFFKLADVLVDFWLAELVYIAYRILILTIDYFIWK